MSIHVSIENQNKNISGVFVPVNGVKKAIQSIWAEKDGKPSLVWRNAPEALCYAVLGGNYTTYLYKIIFNEEGVPTGFERITSASSELEHIATELEYGNNLFLYGSSYSTAGSLSYSKNGKSWTTLPSTNVVGNRAVAKIVYDEQSKLFYVLFVDNYNRIYSSPDAKTWSSETLYASTSSYTPGSMEVGEGIPVGYYYKLSSSTYTINVRYKKDGQWKELTLPTFTTSRAGDPTGIVYGEGMFVVTNEGTGGQMYSFDLETWTKIGDYTGVGISNPIHDAVNHRFLGVDASTKLNIYEFKYNESTSKFTFTKISTLEAAVEELRYCNGYFFAGCTGGKLYYSKDAVNWSLIQLDITSAPFRGIAGNL